LRGDTDAVVHSVDTFVSNVLFWPRFDELQRDNEAATQSFDLIEDLVPTLKRRSSHNRHGKRATTATSGVAARRNGADAVSSRAAITDVS
jgi:hypothetical protein